MNGETRGALIHLIAIHIFLPKSEKVCKMKKKEDQ
jgi:hypothetical protein